MDRDYPDCSYNVGSIALVPGANTVQGTGTSWGTAASMSSSSVLPYVEVVATHGGLYFTFIAKIASVDTTNQILTLERNYPSDADSLSGLQYFIMPGNRTIDLRYPNQYKGTGETQVYDQAGWGTTVCENETAVYLNTKLANYPNPNLCAAGTGTDGSLGCNSYVWGHDVLQFYNTTFSGQQYSSVDNKYNFVNGGSTQGMNFYGEGMASSSFAYRSGLNYPRTIAGLVNNYMPSAPFNNPVVAGGSPLTWGGTGLGGFFDLVTGAPGSTITWQTMRNWAVQGEGYANTYAASCYLDSTRDVGYELAYLILAAEYDPSTTSGDCGNSSGCRGRWISDLAAMYSADLACKRTDNSWSNGSVWNIEFEPITLTNNSTTGCMTGSGSCGGTVPAGFVLGQQTVQAPLPQTQVRLLYQQERYQQLLIRRPR